MIFIENDIFLENLGINLKYFEDLGGGGV